MDEIEKNATRFEFYKNLPDKISFRKKVGSGAKVKNATKVTYKGIEFDSKLELNCYKLLEESGIEFVFKPDKLTLVPGFTCAVLDHHPDIVKAMRKEVRDWAPDKARMELMSKPSAKLYAAECKCDQSRIKRRYNAENKKIVVYKKILPVTWAPDFFLPWHHMYVEAKGFANDSFPIKFKAARYNLTNGIFFDIPGADGFSYSSSAIEVGSKKELEDLIHYLKSN